MPATSLWIPCRTIILDKDAEEFVKENETSQDERFEDQWRGVEWFLARKPDQGIPRNPKEPCKYLIYNFSADKLANT